MSSRLPRANRSVEAGCWTVINELRNPIPVSKPELDALERYFADVVEACLKSQTSPQTPRR
jgi:hypothetical protein